MTRLLRALALVWLAVSLAAGPRLLGQRGQSNPAGSRPTPTTSNAPSQPPAPAPGVILGQVIDARDGRPIAGAIVSLNGGATPLSPTAGNRATPAPTAPPASPRRVLADSQGRFMFFALGSAPYNLSATAPGYMAGMYAQMGAGGTPRPIALALRRFASISGVVFDDIGEPAIGVRVMSFRRQLSNGVPSLVGAQIAVTDDRGVYRLGNLQPGDYLVSIPANSITMPTSAFDTYQRMASQGNASARDLDLAQALNSLGLSPNTGGLRIGGTYFLDGQGFNSPRPPGSPQDANDPLLIYQTMFFPGVATSTHAAAVTLAAGDERANVDFQRRLVRTFKVSGAVTGNEVTANLPVRLFPAGIDEFLTDSSLETATTVTEASGAFTFLGVPSGSYVLKVLRVPRTGPPPAATNTFQSANGEQMTFSFAPPGPASAARPAPPSEPTLWAEFATSVGDADVTDLTMPLRTGARVSGRVEFDGVMARPAFGSPQMTVTLAPSRSINGQIVPPIIGASGQFTTMSLPPGKYLVTGNASGWQLKSAMLAGRDVSRVPLEIAETDMSSLVVTFFDRPSQLSGTVRNARGDLDDSATVILVPADYRSTGNGLRAARVTSDGRYAFGGLLPGEYLVGAVLDDILTEVSDVGRLFDSVARRATRITIGAGDRRAQDLSLR